MQRETFLTLRIDTITWSADCAIPVTLNSHLCRFQPIKLMQLPPDSNVSWNDLQNLKPSNLQPNHTGGEITISMTLWTLIEMVHLDSQVSLMGVENYYTIANISYFS